MVHSMILKILRKLMPICRRPKNDKRSRLSIRESAWILRRRLHSAATNYLPISFFQPEFQNKIAVKWKWCWKGVNSSLADDCVFVGTVVLNDTEFVCLAMLENGLWFRSWTRKSQMIAYFIVFYYYYFRRVQRVEWRCVTLIIAIVTTTCSRPHTP